MMLDEYLRQGLDTGINEASLLNLWTDRTQGTVGLFLSVLTLPPDGPEPSDPRVTLKLSNVGRIAASYRRGRWDDEAVALEPLHLEDLGRIVLEFCPIPIYGSDFFDSDSIQWSRIESKLSMDAVFGENGREHTLDLLLEECNEPVLYLRIWFDEIEIFTPDWRAIPLSIFISGAERWWKAMNAKDPKVAHHGIFPLAPSPARPRTGGAQ
jgi:hypothetical protein